MEIPYRSRLLKAVGKDFWGHWSSHRIWTSASALIALLLLQAIKSGVSSLLTSWRDALSAAGLALLLAVSGNLAISFWRGIKNLDSGFHDQMKAQQQTIAEQASQLEKPPQQTAAETYRYDAARSALERLGPPAVNALRHLCVHGQLVFSLTHPPLPDGMDIGEAMNFYIACVHENLVSRHDINADIDTECPSVIFEIAPGMKSALEELLYA